MLRGENEKNRKEYEKITDSLGEFSVDKVAIEPEARERYLMKKPNEDIFVFDE